MPFKDGHPNPTKTKSNCLCLPFFGHFFLCFFVHYFNKDTKKKQAEVFTFIVVLNILLRLGHKGRRTPVIHTEKEKWSEWSRCHEY